MQAARWLLISAVALALPAPAAWAGPGSTTTTTTSTTIGGTTTTSTTGPSTTTTTGPSTTTTTGGPTTTTSTTTTTTGPPTTATTTTTTTTAAPTTTTSTTLAPGDLSGTRTFVDRINFERSTSLLDISLAGNQFCFAGWVQGTDATRTPNRQVFFEYESNGTVRKADENRVDGDFVDVDLTLRIESGDPPTVEFSQTISSVCRFKASLREAGDRARSLLRCDVGSDLADFGLDDPSDPMGLRQSVQDAYPKRKNIRVNTKTGRVKVKHDGEPTPGGLDVNLTCGGP